VIEVRLYELVSLLIFSRCSAVRRPGVSVFSNKP
jgi:hypothetical protein